MKYRGLPIISFYCYTVSNGISTHLSVQNMICCGVRVSRSLVLCVCFVDRCLSFCTFSFGHFVVCSSSIYGFQLPLWPLQTLLTLYSCNALHFDILDALFCISSEQLYNVLLTEMRCVCRSK